MSLGAKSAERLADKIVLITGASAGIGRATAIEYAAASNGRISLILGARRLPKLKALLDELKEKYPDIKVHAVELDITNSGACKLVLESLPEEFKDIDILINNAGKALGKEQVGDITDEQIDEMLDTNLIGLIKLTQLIVKKFKEKNSGDIVQIGSTAGRYPYPGGSIYCASKFLVRAFTDALRQELVNTNIRVIEVAPGAVETEFSLVRNYGDSEKAKKVYEGRSPLSPEDIAETIVFATSRKTNTVLAQALVLPSDQAGTGINYIKK